jgi:hypothetical protein
MKEPQENMQGTNVKELSNEEYAVTVKKFLQLMDRTDPRTALTTLRKKIKTDPALLRSCHTLTHELGYAAYKKYKNFSTAMKYQDEICNSGYLHGIIEASFTKGKTIVSEMKTLCTQYPTGKFISWECYHGIGHGLMYFTENNLPKSLSFCDTNTTDFARSACINGVFMENFSTDQKLHPSKFLQKGDPHYPCPTQKAMYKTDCYFYAPTFYLSLHKNDYVGTLRWCNTVEIFYRDACIFGVGSQIMKENINNPKFVEDICMKGDWWETDKCIQGMTSIYINHFGSLDPAKKLCPILEKKNQKPCQQIIDAEKSKF